MRAFLALALLLVSALPAFAEEPRGCDKFKWPLDREQAALTASDVRTAAAAALDRASAVAVEIPLSPIAGAKLVMPPERTPKKPDSFAGAATFAAGSAGKYRVSLSAGGWIDLIQSGGYLKPTDFTGALDCPGVRKSVEFVLGAGPFTLQVSDASEATIRMVLTPVQ